MVVVDDRAFIIYFTHPWRDVKGAAEWDRRRSVILAAELEDRGGVLTCDRKPGVEDDFAAPGRVVSERGPVVADVKVTVEAASDVGPRERIWMRVASSAVCGV